MLVDVRYELGDAAAARPYLDEICALYDAVFSAPPFFWREDESNLHRERLVRIFGDPSFSIVLAWAGDELVGFGYGFAVPPGTRRWEGLTEPLDPDLTAEWPGRTFLLFDYGVSAACRGQGIGHRLHDLLLGGRQEERATLTVQPTAVETKRLYERWGWHQVGRMDGGPSGAAPVFDVYLRDGLEDLRLDGVRS